MRPSKQRGLALALGTAILTIGVGSLAAWRRQTPADTPLVTGKAILPAGQQTDVGSFPVNIALTPDGKYAVVTNAGFRQFLSVLSTEDGKIVSQLPFNDEKKDANGQKASLYVGLAFASGSSAPYTLYVSRGPEDRVSVMSVDADGKLTDTGRSLDNPSSLPKEAESARPNFIAGIALSSDGKYCYAANNMTSAYTGQKGSVSVLDTASGKVIGKVTTPGFPYAVALSSNDKKLYVTSERDGVVSVIDVSIPSAPKLVRNLKTGVNPMALLLDKKRNWLFVANAGSDTISVIDTAMDKVAKTLSVRPQEARGVPGATPSGLAQSADGTKLYVTLADMNAVAVLSFGTQDWEIQGYIPTGWYPTSVVEQNGKLLVANARGVQSRSPNAVKQGPDGAWGQYIHNIIEGTVSMIATPDADTLKRMTQQVVSANRLTGNLADANKSLNLPEGIKHVFYIVKENRTYDQVLGDLPQGNGDKSLVLFGRDVTPNQHALAERFVLLDNFYVCGECSADGWCWSTSGMANEYSSRNTPFNYSGRGRNYDFEGTTNGTSVDLQGLPDVAAAPGGFIWQNALKHGVSTRNYGFFNSFGEGKAPDGSALSNDNEATQKALKKITDPHFLRFDMDYPDSDGARHYGIVAAKQKKSYGKFNAPNRYQEWKREFDGYVKRGDLPQFTLLRLCCDHTEGTRPGGFSPRAMVCDNDYGVGQVVEAISKSPYWKSSAIFVLEDDAQAGEDHVDAHRSIAFVISPFVKRSTIDSHFYNTDSMLRTMQAILGLPPMNQYDAVAPVFAFFSNTPDNSEPFSAILPAKEIVGELNKATAYRAKDSLNLNFAQADRIPDAILSDIVWHSVKGAKVPNPPVHRSRSMTSIRRPENDD